MQAACGLGQLNKLDYFIAKRNKNFNYLLEKFKELENYFILPEKTKKSTPSWFGFPLTIRNNKYIKRNDLVDYLESKNIHSRLLFAGNIIKQPYMIDQKFRVSGILKNTDKILHDTFWLGVFPGLNSTMLDYIFETVLNYIKTKTKF